MHVLTSGSSDQEAFTLDGMNSLLLARLAARIHIRRLRGVDFVVDIAHGEDGDRDSYANHDEVYGLSRLIFFPI